MSLVFLLFLNNYLLRTNPSKDPPDPRGHTTPHCTSLIYNSQFLWFIQFIYFLFVSILLYNVNL